MIVRVAFIAAAFLALSGCAIYPTTENITGLDPFAIERRIRCETQTALQDKVIALLKSDSATLTLAENLDSNRLLFRHFSSLKFDAITGTYIKKYLNAAVAYEFTFDITEDNEADGAFDVIGPITGGVFKLNAKAGTDHSREGISHFQASDTFVKLIEGDLHCDAGPRGPNYFYPITGTIGMSNPLKQFIDLNEFGNLSGASATDKVPTYSATFNFQTVINGSLNPQITLSPVTRGFTDASLNGGAKRTDIHKLIVGFSLPPEKGSSDAQQHSLARGGMSLLGPSSLSTSNKTAAELRALDTIQKFKIDNFLSKGTLLVSP
jgi:hypothetical protein